MRYFTPGLYQEMQQSPNTPEFQRRWESACRREENEREEARPFLSENMAYYVNMNWHDTLIDGIQSAGDTVKLRIVEEGADVYLVFRGVRALTNRVESQKSRWLYDEFRRLEDGSFEWGILMNNGEILVRFERLETQVKRRPYLTGLLEEITLENACRNLENTAKEYGIEEDAYARIRRQLIETYDRADILKGRITQAVRQIAGYDQGESLTETEKNIAALDQAVMLLNQKANLDRGWRPYGPLDLPEEDILRRLAALAGKAGLPRLGDLVRHLRVRGIEETDAAGSVGRFLHSCGMTSEEAEREADAWLREYVMAHLDTLRREDDAR